MGIRVLAYRISLFGLRREIQYTLSLMAQEPLAAAHLPVFQGLRNEWNGVLLEETTILDEMANGQAAVDKSDMGLDSFAKRVSNAVNENTDGLTRKQIRAALFKNRPLTKFMRSVLGTQLTAMLDWSDTLAKCGVPALVAMAAEAAALTAAAKSAEQLRAAAQKKNRDFRDVGARKQLIDKVNGARKEAHGALAKLPFENPALPQGFADTFFYSEPPRDEEETIDEVKTAIEELEAQLKERQAQLKKLEEDAALEAQAAAERKALESTADDLEAQGQALLEKAAALKAKLKK